MVQGPRRSGPLAAHAGPSPTHRARIRGRRLTPLTLLAILALLVSIGCCLLALVLRHPYFFDLRVYRAEGIAIRSGAGLSGLMPGTRSYATYPPFAAIVFVPLTLLPQTVLGVLWYLLNIALVGYCGYASCRLVGVPREILLPVSALVVALALWCEPVFITFDYGQVNLVVLALVLWDFTRPPAARFRGLGVGLAVAIKVTPAIFVVYLLLTKRVAMARWAVASFAATLVVSALLLPEATWGYWTHGLFDIHRVGRLENAANQSIRGMLVRSDHTRATRPSELLVVLVVLVLGLTLATLAYRRLDDAWGLIATAICGLLVSPISWSHHWVWCIPLVTLLAFRARWWAVPVGAVFWSFAVWRLPHTNSAELSFSAVQIALSGWYVYAGLAYFVLLALRLRHPRTAQPNTSPSTQPDAIQLQHLADAAGVPGGQTPGEGTVDAVERR